MSKAWGKQLAGASRIYVTQLGRIRWHRLGVIMDMTWGKDVAWTVGVGARKVVQDSGKEMAECKEIDTAQFWGDKVAQAKGMVNSLRVGEGPK